ncbi:MAG: alpha/beta hydrolase, partial [Candidatus Puniceispirillum sp.]
MGKDIPDIAHKILAVTPDKFVLIGFSMGGYIAREICRLAPDRVEKLVLIATSSRGDTAARKVVKDATLRSIDNFSALSRNSIRRSFVETTPG